MQYSIIAATTFLLVCCLAPYAAGDPIKLQFRENGSFKIVQFSDIHWGNGLVKDKKSQALMDEVLEIEKPDLVILTGDIIGGAKSMMPLRQFENVVEPIVDRKLPWAPAFGNHDDESPATRKEQMEAMMALPGCLGQLGPENIHGIGNYIVPVYSATNPNEIAMLLYFFDSNGYPEIKDISRYDWIRPNQIQWYREHASGYKTQLGKTVPAMAFFHIPLPEYQLIWDRKKAIGEKNESVAAPKINSGLFAAFLEQGDVMAMSVGHDHINDFIGELAGVWMCYCRGTGFDTYPREGDWKRGSRIFVLQEGVRDFSTWQRLEEHKVVEQKTMANTEGQERHTPLYESYLAP